MTGIVVVLLLVGLVGGALAEASRRRRSLAFDTSLLEAAPAIAASTGTVDVTALRLGIDGRAAKWVRSELEAIAKTYSDGTADTRARKLREVSVMLRRARDSWIYGGASNEPMRPRDEAIAVFGKHVEEARTRITDPAPASPPATSGPPVSLVLVTVIVAARGELMTVTDAATGEDLRRALEAAKDRAPDDILALDVVWVPEGDATVSSIDVEAVYPRGELHRLDGVTGGKLFCTFCGGPFPAELVSCPHCGGVAPGRESQA